jgi:chromosome segregation ATPase
MHEIEKLYDKIRAEAFEKTRQVE